MSTPATTSGNFLQDLIEPGKRKVVYALYGLVGFIFGCITVAYAAIESAELPTWLIISNAVYTFAALPFSTLAGSNVSTPAVPE